MRCSAAETADVMLDLNDPKTGHIFAVARATDTILGAARRMSVSTRCERVNLQEICVQAIRELRRLRLHYFADRPAIPSTLDTLETLVARLAALPGVPEDGPPADHECPACGAALERRGLHGHLALDLPSYIYCNPCVGLIMNPLATLGSWESGFGPDAI